MRCVLPIVVLASLSSVALPEEHAVRLLRDSPDALRSGALRQRIAVERDEVIRALIDVVRKEKVDERAKQHAIELLGDYRAIEADGPLVEILDYPTPSMQIFHLGPLSR